MPPPRALKRSSWEKCAAGLFCDAAAEHVYIIFPCPIIFFVWQLLWGRGKHDPSRHLSPDRRTRMGRRKISTMLLNTLMCGEIGRISRVGSFVELVFLSTKMMSSFDLCQVLLSPNCRRRIIAWDTKISLTMRLNLRDNGKSLGRCCLRRTKCGRIFGHMRFEALGSRSLLLWMRTHRGCVFICPAAGGGSCVFFVLLKQKMDAFRVVQNRQNSIKIHSKPFKIDKNSF